MSLSPGRRLATMIGSALALALNPGCGGRGGAPARFVPDRPKAQAALIAALESWRRGEPTGPLATTSPGVMVVDRQRKDGQSLEGYEVLGAVPVENTLCFTVRARLRTPAEERLVRYNVFGVDPVWVYRLEDYEMISHWEHEMGDPKAPDGPESW